MGGNRFGVSNRMVWHIDSGVSVGNWVAEKLETGFFAERSEAIGLFKDDKIVAGVIYEKWNGKSIVCHIVIEGRVTPSFIKAICHYAFRVCKVDKVIGPVYSDNEKSIRFVKNMGFVEEARLSDCQPNGDIILFALKRADCRFLGDCYGTEDTEATANN